MKVSVIVPIYNVSQYLHQCIDSLINQSYENIEIILVNDGSDDESLLICHYFKSIDNRILIIDKENNGLVSARKEGLKISSGDLILNVDGDDWLPNEAIKNLVSPIVDHGVDIVVGGYEREFVGNLKYIKPRIHEGVYDYDKMKDDIFPYMISSNDYFSHLISTFSWGKLFRKEIYTDIQNNVPNHISLGEDAAVTYKYLLNCKKIFILNKSVSFYRQRASSILKTFSSNKKEIAKIFELYNFLSDNLPTTNFNIEAQLQEYIMYLICVRTGSFFDKKIINESIYGQKISKADRIGIISSGAFGQKLYNNLKENKYDVIGWFDKDSYESNLSGLNVHSLEELDRFEFDSLIIASLNNEYVSKIKNDYGFHKKKMIYPKSLKNLSSKIFNELFINHG